MLAPPSTETAQRCWRAPGGVSRSLYGPPAAVHPAGLGLAGRLHPVLVGEQARGFMSVIQDPGQARAETAPTTLHVCVTCRAEGDPSEVRAGRRLHDALLAELGSDSAVRVVAVECLSACRRSCAVSLSAPGKWSYVYGDLPAEAAAATVAGAARLYADAPDGLIPWKLRADAIRKGALARIPPSTVPGQTP